MQQIIVIKTSQNEEKFDIVKLRTSILKAYEASGQSPSKIEEILDILKNTIEEYVDEENKITSKDLGDLVEKTLIHVGDFDTAKAYILYRGKSHCEKQESEDKKFKINVIKQDGSKQKFNIKKIKKVFDRVAFDLPECKFEEFQDEIKKYLIDNISTKQLAKLLVKSAIDKVSVENISWQKVAGRLFLLDLYKQASINRNLKIDELYTPKSYLELFEDYLNRGLYFKHFLKFYTKEDILEAGKYIKPERDFDYGYTTILMYNKRYLLNPNKVVKELPQQMYMSAALFLAIPEGLDLLRKKSEEGLKKSEEDKEFEDLLSKISDKDWEIINNPNKHLDNILDISEQVLLHPWLRKKRIEIAKKIYDYTSSGKISLPTPTLLNARTNFHQLSSCFKFNIDDDLRGIYHAIENMAQISKFGGGIGSYLGHIRAKGASIRGVKGASGGVLPWIKVMNDTAIAVNQLGARAGAISVTIDVWHLDILDFLEMQTETGDIRRKAFDVFPAVSIPDLFMKRVINNEKWTLFDPKELRDKLGTRLEDHYGEEFEKLYLEAEQREDIELKEVVNAKELFKQFLRTVVETGMPYVFFRDTSNKYNPNKHTGMVYSTQLCVTADTRIHTEEGLRKIGDLYAEKKEIPIKVLVDKRTNCDFSNQGVELSDSIGIYKTAEQADIFRLTTKEGYEIKATKWHKFYRVNLQKKENGRYDYQNAKIEKVELKDLKKGDFLMIQSGEGVFGKEGSYDLGLLMGLLIGDGTFSYDKRVEEKQVAQICLYNQDINLKDKVLKSLEKVISEYSNKGYFKISLDKKPISQNHKIVEHTDNSKKLIISSTRLGELLKKKFDLTRENKLSVPEEIFASSKETVVGFLQGLFTADGTIVNFYSRKGGIPSFSISLPSISKKLLKDVQILLANFGIKSHIYKLKKGGEEEFTYIDKNGDKKVYKSKSSWRLNISGASVYDFYEKIGFLGYKQDKIRQIIEERKQMGFENPSKKEYYLIQVSNIKYIGKEDVYDTTESKNHSLIFNGIVTGNCTEIIQNTKEPRFIEEKSEESSEEVGRKIVSIEYEAGETVVCNLASINVAKVNPFTEDMEQVHEIAMRILDNVITMNFYPVEETKLTAMKYRPVGLGYMGLAEYLATQAKLRYDSPEAVKHVDELFEKYAYFTLKASVELAKERGKYSLFEGSNRSKGILFGKDEAWFSQNSSYATDWIALIQDIKKYGTRFGYHQAPAPNTSTALVVGTTAGLLPVYKKYFVETNSAAPTVNVAPNLSKENFWLYKEYVHMNMQDVIDLIAAVQKWIDQSISFEWIINPMEVSPRDLFMYYIKAWEKGLKTIYYVRSMSLEVEKCESCAG